MRHGRAVGRLGTLARIAVGFGLVAYAAIGDGIGWNDVVVGLVGFPAVLLLAQVVRLRFTRTPLRATGHLGLCLNTAALALLLIVPATSEAALLWLGASMVLAAWRGYAGCESLAISNWLLRRDDQVGCLIFAPLDEWERQATGREFANAAR